MLWRSMTDSEILAIANPLMDNLMRASTERDYANHIRDFTDRAKGQITAERFNAVCEEYQQRVGFFSQREPVSVFRREASAAIVWKQWSTNTQDEFVAEMMVVYQNDRYLVDHVMIF